MKVRVGRAVWPQGRWAAHVNEVSVKCQEGGHSLSQVARQELWTGTQLCILASGFELIPNIYKVPSHTITHGFPASLEKLG